MPGVCLHRRDARDYRGDGLGAGVSGLLGGPTGDGVEHDEGRPSGEMTRRRPTGSTGAIEISVAVQVAALPSFRHCSVRWIWDAFAAHRRSKAVEATWPALFVLYMGGRRARGDAQEASGSGISSPS